jgi:hypothetical protein
MNTALINDERRNPNELLHRLGQTTDEVANALRVKGIRGVRNTVRFLNPIIRYAEEELQEVKSLDLIPGTMLRMQMPNGTRIEVELPTAVLEFLNVFNRGGYPDLELPTDEL